MSIGFKMGGNSRGESQENATGSTMSLDGSYYCSPNSSVARWS